MKTVAFDVIPCCWTICFYCSMSLCMCVWEACFGLFSISLL